MPGLTNLMGKKTWIKACTPDATARRKSQQPKQPCASVHGRMIVRFDWTWPGLVLLSSTFRLSTLLFVDFSRHWVHAYFASF